MMRILDRVRTHFSPRVQPPVSSRDRIPTWLFSADDDPWKPIPLLMDIALKAAHHAQTIEYPSIRNRPHCPPFFETFPGEQYRLLGALVAEWQPKVIVEIGTFTGLSSLCMRQFQPDNSRLITFDINAWHTVDVTCLTNSDFEDGSLKQELADLSLPEIVEQYRDLLESAELIFMDGPHDGETETKMMNLFSKITFLRSPLFVFDDIKMIELLEFWRSLSMPKLDLTSFGHWTGTGIAVLPNDGVRT